MCFSEALTIRLTPRSVRCEPSRLYGTHLAQNSVTSKRLNSCGGGSETASEDIVNEAEPGTEPDFNEIKTLQEDGWYEYVFL